MKRIFIFIAVTLFFLNGTPQQIQAQQIHQLTHYMLNPFAYNPAVAGNNEQFITKVNFRKQWTGLEGSPTTGILSVHGNFSEQKTLGVGAILYADATGPTRRTGLQLAYAYHLPLADETMYLGLGISGSFMQYRLNFADLVWRDESDPQLANESQSKFGADANLGAFLQGDRFWVGLSFNQLFASKFTFSGANENVQNARHIYLMGGYLFPLTETFDLEPSVLLKSVKGTNPQFEIGAKAYYDGRYWLGLGLRTEDALAIMLGLRLDNGFNLAYSYDFTTSNLNKVSSGAHEITIGYDFNPNGYGY